MSRPPKTALSGISCPPSIITLPATVLVDNVAADLALKGRLPRQGRHLRGPLEATRDFACSLFFVFQNPEPFTAPYGKPWIAIVGDDTLAALGPDGFERASVRALLADCAFVAIVAGEAIPLPYNTAATFASRDRANTAVIETQPEKKDAWFAFVKEASPEAMINISGPSEMFQ